VRRIACGAVGLVLGGSVWANVLIPASSSIGPPRFGGTGLSGFYYERHDPPGVINSLAVADAIIGSSNPTATFRSSLVDYPAGPTDILFLPTFGQLLGLDAASLNPVSATASNASPTVIRFHGYISIFDSFDTQPGNSTIDVNFSFGVDDGVRLRIGNQTVFAIDTVEIVNFPPFPPETASFEAPGLYPLDIVWYDHYGGIGVEWYSSIPGGPNSGAPAGTVGIVPTTVLFPVPEPSSLSLLGIGFLACWRLYQYRAKRGKENFSRGCTDLSWLRL
jgi:hypothetical protein